MTSKNLRDATGKSNDPSFLLRHRMKIQATGDDLCTMCRSPWHPATGGIDPKLCGACVRSLAAGQKEIANMRRTCGGVPFYQHNQPLDGLHRTVLLRFDP